MTIRRARAAAAMTLRLPMQSLTSILAAGHLLDVPGVLGDNLERPLALHLRAATPACEPTRPSPPPTSVLPFATSSDLVSTSQHATTVA
jgi:hypothetical protein